ncbi:cation diffusion facilitator family transporter [Xanthomonas arboricola pv. juglandis]|uniref:cation diffusion facilitator family transporter n=1 Tax=Xanthomonas arboricola TaxID=56448 RepID=UPI00063E8801|nr:cation diffusion facilitator family transporter [Xanthomonas arboricola]MDN0221573.1 cation diffusion facilitator family transporter [Xanthomonas arboricola pv. juglandis]MDN0225847.1 cation diffusion facilitator family transporter [Xanthomonas arboricola pv. juglandis]MDN0230005.1 cation diffusion facilitator family transporter [Xanthomonas arboricola pv. juglandis]MDN0234329.1 cation diffusion facilitator family transporter [Xanthomonas arboricola pv. juglandis]MDN0238626.1 cation diffusi
MSGNHDHAGSKVRFEKPLWWALGLTSLFLAAEVVGGFLTNSLALISDAAHMLTDTIALAVSLFAVRISRRPADKKRSYGYGRVESLGALVNGSLLLLVAGYILWEAITRFRQPPHVASTGMLFVAISGLIVNLIAMRLLKSGSGSSLNLKGAYLEVWSDMLGSVGVIIGALVIRWTNWTLIDPVIAVLIGLWVLPRTWTLISAAGRVLMQSAPVDVDITALERAMRAHADVDSIHNLHIWSLASRQTVVTAHVVVKEDVNALDRVRCEVTGIVRSVLNVYELTLQVECVACDGSGARHDSNF